MMMLQLQLHFVLVLVLQFQFHPSLSQQQYRGNQALNCNRSENQYLGYICNGPQESCQSYLTFRSRPPYDSPLTIADLMGSEASSIASTNQASSESYIFQPETLVTVPVSCSCWGKTYLHIAPYMVQKDQSYSDIANVTYQGLTACQTVAGANDYLVSGGVNLTVESVIMVPITCACPSSEQAENKVSSLLVYMVTWEDTLYAIGNRFGVSLDSLYKANNLTESEFIYPFIPLLVPLQDTSCSSSQRHFLCKKAPPSAKSITILGLCIGIGFLCLFFICYFSYHHLKKRRHRIMKQKLFVKNGGHLLQKRLASSGSSEKLKLFTAEELERATDNYSKSRFLGHGGYGNVYKGMLLDGTIVAVKRSKTMDKTRIEQFINEVAILSQINHRNVVKLLGSCLETELPLLVYEFISKGSLSDHIHSQYNVSESESESSYLPWAVRFRIASEVAGAVAYMHSAASIPIFHRDIKSSNILLDDKYSAKVSDFGTSRSVPIDKTHLTTAVQETFGYLDPEYFQSSRFTDKSDVYSFGVVLVELLTGKKPNFCNENGNIVSQFISLTNEERLEEILDARIAREVSKREVVVIGKLVKRCLRLNWKKRPPMKEVATGLENLMKSQTCLDLCQEPQVLFREDESVLDSEDEMKLIFVEESFANVSFDMDWVYPRD